MFWTAPFPHLFFFFFFFPFRILHDFENDFYDCHLKLMVLGYIRPELKFTTLDALIAEIKADGDFTEAVLDQKAYSGYIADSFFQNQAKM